MTPSPLETRVVAAWARLGVLFSVAPAPHSPDLERLILESLALAPSNPRLLIMALTWLLTHYRVVGKHRLAQMVKAGGSREQEAALGLLLDEVDHGLLVPHFRWLSGRCRRVPKPRPFFAVYANTPAMARLAEAQASEVSRRWGLWCPNLEDKPSALRPAAWIAARNPGLGLRGLFKGGLKTSILAELEAKAPSAPSEADLARSCGVSRKALHEALDDLDYARLIRREPQGRCVRVSLAQGQGRKLAV